MFRETCCSKPSWHRDLRIQGSMLQRASVGGCLRNLMAFESDWTWSLGKHPVTNGGFKKLPKIMANDCLTIALIACWDSRKHIESRGKSQTERRVQNEVFVVAERVLLPLGFWRDPGQDDTNPTSKECTEAAHCGMIWVAGPMGLATLVIWNGHWGNTASSLESCQKEQYNIV